MTNLEKLIRQQVDRSTVTTINRATEKIAEEMANELLKDIEFRTRMRKLIDKVFGEVINKLDEEK